MTTLFEDAGEALRDDLLYVHPDVEAELAEASTPFDDGAQTDARDVLEDAETPVRVAVLPMSASDGKALELAEAAGENGSYLAILPNFDTSTAHNMGFPAGSLDRAARASAASSDGDIVALISDFVDRVEDLAAGGTGAPSEDAPQDGGSGYLPLGILIAAGGGGFLVYRRNKRHRELADLDQVRTALDEDITAYGEELIDLDVDVRAAAEPIESREEYARALDLYEGAKTAAERAEKPGHLRPVTSSLEEGRWLLTRVRARRNGETPPDRRPPCFFDPRHGPSVEAIAWAPPSGVARQVPACAADATRIRDGNDPDARMVEVNGERRPYWEAGPAYNAWAGGYYGAVLPAMFVGTMLGSNAAYAAHGAAGEGGWGGDGGVGGGGFDGGYDGGGGFDGGFDGGGFGGGFDGGF